MSSTTSWSSAAAIVCSSRWSSAQIARDAPRVVDELLAGAPNLAAMAALGELEGAPDEVAVDVRVVGLDAREQLLDEALVVLLGADDRHELSVRTSLRKSWLRSRRGRRGCLSNPGSGTSELASGEEFAGRPRTHADMHLVHAYLERRRLRRMLLLLAVATRR